MGLAHHSRFIVAKSAAASRATSTSQSTILLSMTASEPRIALNEIGRHDAAGQAIPQEVVEPIGAQPGNRLLQERIDRIVVEFPRRIAQPRQGTRDVGTLQHQGLELLVMILLLRGEDEIDRVRKRGVRDVVQQARHLFAARGPQSPQQDKDAQAVLEAGHVLERKGERRRTGLPDSLQPLKRRTADQVENPGVLDRDSSINPIAANALTWVSAPRGLKSTRHSSRQSRILSVSWESSVESAQISSLSVKSETFLQDPHSVMIKTHRSKSPKTAWENHL